MRHMRSLRFVAALASCVMFGSALAQAAEPARTADIAKREEARKASMSLGKTGGAVSNTGKVTPEQLNDIKDILMQTEFDSWKA